jgi:NADH dehydrogenase
MAGSPAQQGPGNGTPRRIVVVGAGFAGFHCLRQLERLLPPEAAEIVVVSPTDYMPYLALLPEVGAGIVDPRHIAVSLSTALSRVRLIPGYAVGADLTGRACQVEDLEGRRRTIGWDRLVLAPGSVTRTLPVPGVAEHAVGFKTIAEALYLRDHLLAQLELADAAEDPAERRARCTFVVVGAGYTGTEVAAQGQLFTQAARRHHRQISPEDLCWILVDLAPTILPELGERLGRPALRIPRRRGLEIRLRTTVEEATANSVRLSDGSTVATHTLVWCVGVTPGPLTRALDLKTVKGRIVVDEYLTVPDHREVFAAGDAAAVPDPARPGGLTPMTAQQAQRQALPRRTTSPRRWATARRARTGTATSASSSTSGGGRRSPTRCACRCPALWRRCSPAPITCLPCRGTGCGWRPIGSTT